MSTTVQQAIAALPLPEGWRWRVDCRPRRRTLGIEVTPDGEVVFAVPMNADPGTVAAAVRRRLPRLGAVVRRRTTRPGEPVKELVVGSSFAYLGRRYRLRLVEAGPHSRVRLRAGWLELPEPSSPVAGVASLVGWYTERGRRWLAARTDSVETRIGVRSEGVTVGDLGVRWGSCTADGSISLHWAVMQLPPDLIEYVLVHELCHLKEPGHGPAFRREMTLALPDFARRETWFEQEEPFMWRGSVR
ncbi:M48 family metallopeptidase [Streptantibioticus ferralitis]|uniref:SprT family zinc-dependent metalloprotease n=1 Tax=Streptantibioticus ferralitis TaxID=236510 RepID=A0ABT5Z1K8_9ACTN|nr:SprT family zinc-dependent metalloprotease [Streptantibioticus ferralitis]MDF2257643.1 SprT family zinc-dependent metalloprotease [Streptantibioticus ferralitis]